MLHINKHNNSESNSNLVESNHIKFHIKMYFSWIVWIKAYHFWGRDAHTKGYVYEHQLDTDWLSAGYPVLVFLKMLIVTLLRSRIQTYVTLKVSKQALSFQEAGVSNLFESDSYFLGTD